MFSIASCNEAYDKSEWLQKDPDDKISPLGDRNSMLKDLTKNHKLVGLTFAQLSDLLGAPDNMDSDSCAYNIIVCYDMIDPSYIKKLHFHFSADSVITSFNISEWKRR